MYFTVPERESWGGPEYRAQQAEREAFREIAWLLIKCRMDKGLSQEKLAALVGTSHSQISRIESGRHRTNLDTLSRIAHALERTTDQVGVVSLQVLIEGATVCLELHVWIDQSWR